MFNQFIHHVFLASLCSSYFACMLMLFWSDLFKYVGARWSYYLWFIIVIPWLVVWLPLNVFPELDLSPAVINIPSQYHLSYPAAKLIFICWLLGASALLLYFMYKHLRFNYSLKVTSSILTDHQQHLIKKSIANSDVIPLAKIYLSTFVSMPMITHIWRSAIYLPHDFFDIYTLAEQKYIFQHEGLHYQRCDLIANTMMLFLVCINWFNPIIYFARRYFSMVQEISCDEILGSQYSPAEKKAYGYTLLKSVTHLSVPMRVIDCTWSRHHQLKERCHRLVSHRPKPLKNLFGLLLFTAAVGITIAVPNLGKPDASREFRVANSTLKKLSLAIDNHCLYNRMIDANSIKVFSPAYIMGECSQSRSECEILIYPTTSCLGKPLGAFTFDVVSGSTSVKDFAEHFHLAMRDNNLFINDDK